eukprot:scaffold2330_cov41-Prasinocladus_malaysianus.AAC.2
MTCDMFKADIIRYGRPLPGTRTRTRSRRQSANFTSKHLRLVLATRTSRHSTVRAQGIKSATYGTGGNPWPPWPNSYSNQKENA